MAMQNKSKFSIIASAVLAATLSLGCEELRPRAANGVRAGLDCQQANLQAVIVEAGALARAFVLSTISGDGTPDTEALRAAARGLKSDGLRCAFAAAVAALATPPSSSKAVGAEDVQALGIPVEGQLLRQAMRDIAAQEWGVKTILTNQGQL